MLEGGMALLHTEVAAISRAWALMRAGVSRSTPLGATDMPAQTGSTAWHMLQRLMTMSSTCWKLAGAASARLSRAHLSEAGPSVESHTISTPHTTATPQVHHGLDNP